MILSNGSEVLPAYMSIESKEQLKMFIGNNSQAMYCACKIDVPDDEKLYYRLSRDLHFIPIHKGYEHEPTCSRFSGLRNCAFVSIDSADNITAFLKFNPRNFNPTANQEKLESEEDASVKGEKIKKIKDKAPKEPYLNLKQLIRCINIDAYMERLVSTGVVLSKDYFINVVKSRTKKIVIAGDTKTLRDLNYKDDRCQFFYCKYVGIEQNDRGFWELILENNGRTFKTGIREEIAKKAVVNFMKDYSGDKPVKDDCIMAAGFIYKRVSRYMKEYYTVGRVHIFKTTKYEGIYCRNNSEKNLYEIIFRYIHYKNKKAKLVLPVEEEAYNCQVKIENAYGEIFLEKKNRNYQTTNKCLEFVNDEFAEEQIVDFLDNL